MPISARLLLVKRIKFKQVRMAVQKGKAALNGQKVLNEKIGRNEKKKKTEN